MWKWRNSFQRGVPSPKLCLFKLRGVLLCLTWPGESSTCFWRVMADLLKSCACMRSRRFETRPLTQPIRLQLCSIMWPGTNTNSTNQITAVFNYVTRDKHTLHQSNWSIFSHGTGNTNSVAVFDRNRGESLTRSFHMRLKTPWFRQSSPGLCIASPHTPHHPFSPLLC